MKTIRMLLILAGGALFGCSFTANNEGVRIALLNSLSRHDLIDGETKYKKLTETAAFAKSNDESNMGYTWSADKGDIVVGQGVGMDNTRQVEPVNKTLDAIVAGARIYAAMNGLPIPDLGGGDEPTFESGSDLDTNFPLANGAAPAPKGKHGSGHGSGHGTKPPHQQRHSHDGGQTHHKHKQPHNAQGGHGQTHGKSNGSHNPSTNHESGHESQGHTPSHGSHGGAHGGTHGPAHDPANNHGHGGQDHHDVPPVHNERPAHGAHGVELPH